jgi:hypothetical protein
MKRELGAVAGVRTAGRRQWYLLAAYLLDRDRTGLEAVSNGDDGVVCAGWPLGGGVSWPSLEADVSPAGIF